MKYACPACTWTGDSEVPFPCPACGVGDAAFPLVELKEHLRVIVSNPADALKLRCGDCGAVSDLDAWLSNSEHCPSCGSHDGLPHTTGRVQ
jgi:rubrerythrin